MDKKKAVTTLKDLIQVDIDAYHAYAQAIERIDVPEIRERLTRFRTDHERHVDELSRELREMGEKPPEFSRDFKGYLIEGFTALTSIAGTRAALMAMQGNEKLTNRNYARGTDVEMPANVRTVVEKGYQDEQRHLSYIEETLKTLKK